MTIRDKARERAEHTYVREYAKSKGQGAFLEDVMRWEGCSLEEAMLYCTGKTDPIHWEYTLGYKLADPVWNIGIYKQIGHHARAKAAANFRKLLTPEEDELFVTQCLGKTARAIRKDYKREIKAAKKKKPEVDISELEGDDDED